MPRKVRKKYQSDYDALIDYLDQMGADVAKSFSIKHVPAFLNKNRDHELFRKAVYRLSKIMDIKGYGLTGPSKRKDENVNV